MLCMNNTYIRLFLAPLCALYQQLDILEDTTQRSETDLLEEDQMILDKVMIEEEIDELADDVDEATEDRKAESGQNASPINSPAAAQLPLLVFPKRKSGLALRPTKSKIQNMLDLTSKISQINALLDRKIKVIRRKWNYAKAAKEILAKRLASMDQAHKGSRKRNPTNSVVKDSTGPKRPGNAFIIYCQMNRPALNEELKLQSDSEAASTLGKTTAILAQRWRDLDAASRQKYQDIFNKEMSKFKSARTSNPEVEGTKDVHPEEDVQDEMSEASDAVMHDE